MKPASITYDKHANALDIALRDDRSVRQQLYTDDVIVDFDADGNLLSIEVLDLTLDLTSLVRDYGLDPHLLEVIAKVRALASKPQSASSSRSLRLVAMRHILVHDYFRVDPGEVWLTMERDIPELKKQIRAILQRTA